MDVNDKNEVIKWTEKLAIYLPITNMHEIIQV